MPKEKTPDFYEKARDRFSAAKEATQDIREKAEFDLRMVHGDQWDEEIRTAREEPENAKPVLSLNREHNLCQYVANQARQNKPSIHVNPVGNGASEDTAKVFEGIFRHIDYVSQADIARDHAVSCATECGFGYYRIRTEYVGKKSFNQEPRVERILDQMSVYFDPDCQQPDRSDANYVFIRKKLPWDDYKQKYPNASRQGFDEDDKGSSDWQTKDHIIVAEYFWVEKKKHILLQLTDGTVDWKDVIEETHSHIESKVDPETGEAKGVTVKGRTIYEDEVLNEREEFERIVHFDTINGVETLEETDWLGEWIPIIFVPGKEAVVDGKLVLESLVRFIHDAQKLTNIYTSAIAEACGSSLRAQLLGYKGQFKGWKEDRVRDQFVLQVEPMAIGDEPAPLPRVISHEPPIVALTQALNQAIDSMKAGANIFDSSTGAAQAEYSGISVQKRVNQADLVNFHFIDNLTRATWFEGKIKLDLIPKVIDTPQAVRILGEDGSISIAMIATALGDDDVQHAKSPQGWKEVPGKEGEKHHRLDVGEYDVTVTSGPTYANRFQENFELLTQIMQQNPAAWQLWGDLLFENWQDMPAHKELAKRARMGLLPAVQQELAGEEQQVTPAQVAALQSQLQMVTQQLRQALFEKKTEILKLQNDMHMKLLDSFTKITVADRTAKAQEGIADLQARIQAIDRTLDLLPDFQAPGEGDQAGPDQDGQPQPGAPPPSGGPGPEGGAPPAAPALPQAA